MLRRFGLLVLGLVFFVAPFTFGEEDPTAGLPEGVDPLPTDLGKKMRNLLKAAEKFRGLPCKHNVPSGSVGEAELKRKMVRAFEEELPDSRMVPLETALKAFGFIPETMSLKKYYPELLSSQVAGFYDPRRQYLATVRRDASNKDGDALKNKFGEKLATKWDETVLVHEYCHAIQDQHFNLRKYSIDDPLADSGLARTAVVEGDATQTMMNFFLGFNADSMPGAEERMRAMIRDPKKMVEGDMDMPGTKEMANAPAWFRDNLLFSYFQGYIFCMAAKREGGQKLLDSAFTTNPPTSTEQIIHPEKWLGKRDDPIEIPWPDLSLALSGYRITSQGTLGEQTINVLLADKIKADARIDVAESAAAGWGGDHFVVYTKGDERVLLWITEWDTAGDAREFKAAVPALGADWTIEAPSATRVVLMRGKLPFEVSEVVKTKLSDAPAVKPANTPIDFAALGIDKKAVAQGNSFDPGDLLKNPELMDMVKDMFGKDGNDLGKLMDNPAVKDMMKSMLKADQPKGALSDPRTYTNEKAGFSIKLPDSAKGWTIDATPKPAQPGMPGPLVSITDPSKQIQISVVSQALPIAMEIEKLGPFIEMPLKSMIPGYKKISQNVITTGTKKGLELEYEGAVEGSKLKFFQRMYTANGKMMVVSAVGPQSAWEGIEALVKETLNTFKFLEPRGEVVQEPKKE